MSTLEKVNTAYRFLNIKGIGFVQTNKFLTRLSSESNSNDIQKVLNYFLKEQQIKEYLETQDISETANVKSKFEVKFITLIDCAYPEDLKKHLKLNAPPVLSYVGNLNLLNKKKAAFSGSRNVSEKGLQITKDCVRQLIEKDIVIVSGYAKGVDCEAHKTALENNGATIIVLPEGINSFTIKRELKDTWNWDNILVISEFNPTDIWTASRAMQRNNTIIALSDVVVVVEAGETGGSLDAGLKSLELGKYLFVPEYKDFPESALGNKFLLKKGAYSIKRSKATLKSNLSQMEELININNYQLFN